MSTVPLLSALSLDYNYHPTFFWTASCCNYKFTCKWHYTASLIILLFTMSGNIEWEDKKKQRCFVMWRTPDEWAALIFKWVTMQSFSFSLSYMYDIMYVLIMYVQCKVKIFTSKTTSSSVIGLTGGWRPKTNLLITRTGSPLTPVNEFFWFRCKKMGWQTQCVHYLS